MPIRKVEPYEEDVPEFPDGTYSDKSDWHSAFIWGFVSGMISSTVILLISGALG